MSLSWSGCKVLHWCILQSNDHCISRNNLSELWACFSSQFLRLNPSWQRSQFVVAEACSRGCSYHGGPGTRESQEVESRLQTSKTRAHGGGGIAHSTYTQGFVLPCTQRDTNAVLEATHLWRAWRWDQVVEEHTRCPEADGLNPIATTTTFSSQRGRRLRLHMRTQAEGLLRHKLVRPEQETCLGLWNSWILEDDE